MNLQLLQNILASQAISISTMQKIQSAVSKTVAAIANDENNQ